jgi:hypothetical protein
MVSLDNANIDEAREAANNWLCGDESFEEAGRRGVDAFRTHNRWKLLDGEKDKGY